MKKLKIIFRITFFYFLFFALSNNSVNAQSYCIPLWFDIFGPDPFTGITKVVLDGTPALNSSTPYDDKYSYDSTSLPALIQGGSYTISVTFYDGAASGLNSRIWIDWNQDFDFDDAGEMIDTVGMNEHAAGIISKTFTVPLTAVTGITRMRVFCDMPESQGHISPVPCGYADTLTHPVGHHGDVDDYAIRITLAVFATDFTASATTINVGQNIDFTDQSSGVPTSWTWSFEGGTPATSTSQNPGGIVYNTVGTYSVELISSDGTDTDTSSKTDYITVNAGTGIESNFDNQNFKLYPNPAKDHIFLGGELFTNPQARIEIINVLGELVMSLQVSPASDFNSRKIDLSRLYPGLYFLQVTNGTSKEVHKIIVE